MRAKVFGIGMWLLVSAGCAEGNVSSTEDAGISPQPDASTSDTLGTDAANDTSITDTPLTEEDTAQDAPIDTPQPVYEAVYLPGRIHSPMTKSVVNDALSTMDPSLALDRFSKYGTRLFSTPGVLDCFETVDVSGELNRVVTHFRAERSFERTGITGNTLSLASARSQAEDEVLFHEASFALVAFGERYYGSAGSNGTITSLESYVEDLNAFLLELDDLGQLPILIGPLPEEGKEVQTARLTTAARGLAESLQIPFVDMALALDALPTGGISSNGSSLTTAESGPCDLGTAATLNGVNQVNRILLEALDRVLQITLDGVEYIDTVDPERVGDGSPASPIEITALPFAHYGDTSLPGLMSELDQYLSCSASQNEGGPEFIYAFNLPTSAQLRISVVDFGSSDLDIHMLSEPSEAACIARDDKEIFQAVPPGQNYLSVDTYVSASTGARSGEYLLVIEKFEN